MDDIAQEYLQARSHEEKANRRENRIFKISSLFIAIASLFVSVYFSSQFIVTEINKNISQNITNVESRIKSAISTNINSTSTNNNSLNQSWHLPGSGDAKIHTVFTGGASQACWYYHANYETSHPYTVLWEISGKNKVYPKIRVIADKGKWEAEKCVRKQADQKSANNKTEDSWVIKLIGTETIEHRIEAQFKENDEYFHIANASAKYPSALQFNDQGIIIHRKVLEPEENDTKYGNKTNPIPNKYTSYDYNEALEIYETEREELHRNLYEVGCGAISVQPILSNDNNQEAKNDDNNKFIELEKPSIIYICHKEGKKSHVRVMQRI